MAPRNRVGFTLVELLVVVAIISVLIGLMVPAVIAARDRARVTQCAQRQGELGKAMLTYESTKGYFPGYINVLHGNTVSWAPLMLPYVNRNDLWVGTGTDTNTKGWRTGGTSLTARIDQFVCPSDESTGPCLLSFVVNVGTNTTSGSVTGVFRDRTPSSKTRSVSTSDMASASRRPMIAETRWSAPTDMNQTDYKDPDSSFSRLWNSTGTDATNGVTAVRFGFVWPNDVRPVLRPPRSTGTAAGAMYPIHANVINITFCDAHTETLAAEDPDAACDKFDNTVIK
jgi:prepilin-type N-terminal cleavage/methylation domain-containing protein